jgi:PAS domain S-box-containing protein
LFSAARSYDFWDAQFTVNRRVGSGRTDATRALDAEAQLALALECGGLGTWHVDLDAQRVKLSSAAAAMFGLDDVDEDVVEFVACTVHPDDRAAVGERWRHAATTRTSYAQEFRIIRPDGAQRWISVRGSTKVLGDQRPYFSGVVSDVTERKQLETTVIADRHKLEAIFRESPAAMALWCGPDLVFELVNPRYQAIFGDRPLVGLRLADAAPELERQGFVALLQRVLETGEPYVGREVLAQIAGTDGTLEDHYFDFTYVRVLDTEGKPYGVYDHAIDVTDRVIARREMDQERDLRERLVAALSHDLRTPLATGKLAAQLLVHKAHDPRLLAIAAKRIEDNMDRADRMIRDLLDVSRIRGGQAIPLEIESCDLTQVASAVVEDMIAMHGKRFMLASSSPAIGFWDGHALRRILENFASNAAKYGAPGTPITIRLTNEGDYVRAEVHNHGKPIAAEEIPLLFDLFRRSRGATPNLGWGIGLSLVQALVQAHGGTITVASSAATGTTFAVRLPRRRPRTTASAQAM